MHGTLKDLVLALSRVDKDVIEETLKARTIHVMACTMLGAHMNSDLRDFYPLKIESKGTCEVMSIPTYPDHWSQLSSDRT
mmetsp:Transcript_143368/g.267221  ORF Transcript_143368/g.267221 Transcript_143368/m.267221 type:complete len:80 (-) Transcript_143368:35-274(-)